MGRDKATLLLGDKPMGAWVGDALAAADVAGVVLAGGSPSLARELGLELVPDVVQGKGPLSALHALLTRFDAVAVVPCDVPMMTAEVVDALVAAWRTSGADVAVASCGGQMEPLVSVWRSESSLPVVEQHLTTDDLAIHRLFDQLTTCVVETDPMKLININTVAEFDELKSGL